MNLRTIVSSVIGVAAVAVPAIAHAERCSDGTEADEIEPPSSTPSTGEPSAVHERRVHHRDEDCIERNIYMMPGVFGAFFTPTAGLGSFYGAGVQIAPYQWSHNNDRFGPSQGGLFVNAAFLQSPKVGGTMGLFEAGISASLERNSSRRVFIPYFGGTMGAVTHTQLTGGYVYPFGGIHLYWHRNLMIDAQGGYHFPFEDIDHEKGIRADLAVRFSLW